jgi:hypothetical protein
MALMLFARFSRSVNTLLFALLAAVGVSFSHVATTSAMQSMKMGHAASGVVCQQICMGATKTEGSNLLGRNEEEKQPLPLLGYTASILLALITLRFVVKNLHLLSSWRPPDRLLLCGHYADGL